MIQQTYTKVIPLKPNSSFRFVVFSKICVMAVIKLVIDYQHIKT